MSLKRILLVLVFLSTIIWGIVIVRQFHENSNIENNAERERKKKLIEFKRKKNDIIKSYNSKKYLATGKTVYERIFNKPNQSLIELTENIATETFPADWSIQVKVEEFSHFVLLVYLPHNSNTVNVNRVISHLKPILEHCGWFLSNIAVFDGKHKAYLYFSQDELLSIQNQQCLLEPLKSAF